MIHPLLEDLSKLKDAELEAKFQSLSKKFFMVSNPTVRVQIQNILEIYQKELAARRAANWENMYQKRDKGLDNLINVN